jgi:hypothetical protein
MIPPVSPKRLSVAAAALSSLVHDVKSSPFSRCCLAGVNCKFQYPSHTLDFATKGPRNPTCSYLAPRQKVVCLVWITPDLLAENLVRGGSGAQLAGERDSLWVNVHTNSP